MLKAEKLILRKVQTLTLLLLFSLVSSAQSLDKQNKDMFRTFVELMNNGQEEEFYHHAAQYEAFLKQNKLYEQYFKIKTNVGFHLVSHQHPLRGMRTALELDSDIRAYGDTTLLYLVTGLRGDIYKSTHHFNKADSAYKMALTQVGQKDEKFVMLVNMSLAEVNLTMNPEEALRWADKAQAKAAELNNIEYQSMSLGAKGYIFFMLAEKDSFLETYRHYSQLKAQFDSLETKTKQRFNKRYANVMKVATLAFDNKFEEAIDMANNQYLSVDRQMVIFRIFGMEGVAEKEKAYQRLVWGFTAMTLLYIFIYIMGRRRLMHIIWKRQAELKVAFEKAEAANKTKAAFIRSMSHEIRTPLNAINGFSQVLCSPEFELSEEEKSDLKQRITSNSEAITLIINELLELASGESNTLDENSLIDVQLNKVCRKAIATAKEQQDKHLKLRFMTDVSDDFMFKSNDETILNILSKLIDNAQKFTNEGDVTIHASVNDTTVEISVTDTGIGIPEERQEDVFDNFVKLDDYKEGVGLGLPICRRLAHSLGGDIVIDKTYKKGSRFVLRLPVK